MVREAEEAEGAEEAEEAEEAEGAGGEVFWLGCLIMVNHPVGSSELKSQKSLRASCRSKATEFQKNNSELTTPLSQPKDAVKS